MAITKKAQGRPKKVVEPVVEIPTQKNEAFSNVSEEEKPIKSELIEAPPLVEAPPLIEPPKKIEVKPTKVVEKKTEPIQSKVVEVSTQSPQKTTKKPPSRYQMHEVFIKGKPREVTLATYEAVSKDPKLDVTLPKGSQLKPVDKPCENC